MTLSSPPPVQIFGRRDSRDTQKAQRFFKERRVPVSFVDVAVRAPARGELRRFVERFGGSSLIDTSAPAYRDAGLAYMRLSNEEILERLLERPTLLRLPLVRRLGDLTVGVDEKAWASWLRPGARSGASSRP